MKMIKGTRLTEATWKKFFLAICRCGNMTKAAENLYISQPSLSSRLKTLEREIGQALFYRHKGGRETVLTPIGEEFYRLAVEYEGVLDRMQRLCAAEPMKLRVSSIHSVGTYILPSVYDAFMQKYPEIELVIQDLEFEMVRKSVVQGFTDIAFNASGKTGKGFKVRPAFSEPMVLVCAADFQVPRRTINCVTSEEAENNPCVKNFIRCMREALSDLIKEGLELLL